MPGLIICLIGAIFHFFPGTEHKLLFLLYEIANVCRDKQNI